MAKEFKLIYCPKGKKECRHCSNMQIVNVKRVGVIKTGAMERIVSKVNLGKWCECDGRHYVRDLKTCPVEDGKKVKLVPFVLSELAWSQRRS